MRGADVLGPGGAGQPTRRAVALLLGLLLVWALGLRVWYATPELGPTRYWDERYPLQNIELLLRHGDPRPAHGLHPAFSHLPHAAVLAASQALHRGLGIEAFAVLAPEEGFTPTAYLLCRLVQCLFASASLGLLFLVGRRLGGDRLGLLAAFLLAVTPWHLRQSVIFKADMVLLFSLLLAFLLTLRAAERPGAGTWALAGGGIGLALASKFNGGPIAVPLALAALLERGRRGRNLLLLALAAAVSVAVFVVLNPYLILEPEIYTGSMGRTVRVYARKGQQAGIDSPLEVVGHALDSLLGPGFHGPVIGAAAILGLVATTVLALRSLSRSRLAGPWLMVSTFVVAYTGAYAVSTPNPSDHNYLPLAPFFSLTAAWTLLTAWRIATPRLREGSGRVVAVAACAALVLPLTVSASRTVYDGVVPRTGDLLLQRIQGRLGRPTGRIIVTEHDFEIDFDDRHLPGRLALLEVDELRALPGADLDRADVEVFPARRLQGPGGDTYRRRVERAPADGLLVVEPRLFRARGPSLVGLFHPRRRAGRSLRGILRRSVDDPKLYVGPLPRLAGGGDLVSLELLLPRRAVVGVLSTGSRTVLLATYRGPALRQPHVTQRFDWVPWVELRFERPPGDDSLRFDLRHWREDPGPNQPDLLTNCLLRNRMYLNLRRYAPLGLLDVQTVRLRRPGSQALHLQTLASPGTYGLSQRHPGRVER